LAGRRPYRALRKRGIARFYGLSEWRKMLADAGLKVERAQVMGSKNQFDIVGRM
jgi:hypothetical protein